nr:ATP synthase subunit C [uncultured Ruminococcus sp.]
MSVFDFLFMALPVVFLIASVLIAVKAVSRGKSRKRTLMMQLASFAAVFAICMVCPFVASAASETVEVARQGSFGMAYIGAAAATGLSCIGGGIAVGNAAPAAIGATSEDPKAFGKAIIFVALGEGIALYGMLISIMILSKIG